MAHSNEYLVNSIFGYAICFDIAGESLGELLLSSEDPSKDINFRLRGFSVVWPKIVNDAFAVELYLKSILQFEENQKKGHNLRKLFDALSSNAQQEIRYIYDNEVKSLPKFHQALASFKDVRGHHNFEFDDVLNDASEAFAVVRYFYEEANEEKFKNWFIFPLKVALYRYFIKEKPELKKSYMTHS